MDYPLHNKALTCICEWLSRIITANKSKVPVYEAEIKHQCVRFQMWHVSQRPKQKQTSMREESDPEGQTVNEKNIQQKPPELWFLS